MDVLQSDLKKRSTVDGHVILTSQETNEDDMKPGDFVANVAHDKTGGVKKLKAWSMWKNGMKFFVIPYAATGTVITVSTSEGTEWCKVLFPQGVGWVMSRYLAVV